eukprot:TRINITY_DN68847_c0_g1_i1.p1 TRINITY_DN68847_c0_g1~~TRINITY_DN68847_c0_g1_i1.p1  ORF type:complete len:289 (-),score=52.92 TRINITY_DN68847_c0_g1_i1:118-903(-)
MAEVLGWHVSLQRQLFYLAESAKEGQAAGLRALGDYSTLYEARASEPELAKYWDPWMENQNSDVLEKVTSLVGYSTSGNDNFKMLDWCGNTGYNSLTAMRHFASMHATVLDLPSQCDKADAAALAHGLSSRMSTLPCDLSDVSVTVDQGKFDSVLMTHAIREWSSENVQRFIHLAHSALQPGGSILIDGFWPSDAPVKSTGEYLSGSVAQGLALSYFLASASSECCDHEEGDLREWLSSAGFTDIERMRGVESVWLLARRP